MANITGTCAAAFISLALRHRPNGGTFGPEGWVTPAEFHADMSRRGVPSDYLGPITETIGTP